MATLLNSTTEPNNSTNEADGLSEFGPDSNGSSSLFQRKIEFLLARKPFTGFSNGGGDFRLVTLNPSSSSLSHRPVGLSQSAMTGKRPDGSEFMENGLDLELSFGITFRRIGAGLQNLGNTCFLNSVLQCLTYTEPLAAYLQSGKHKTSCRTAGFCALCAIQNHVSRALQSTGRILAPKDLVSNLRCISRNFRNSRQEDAHECMVNLLESMHRCCLPSGVPSESPSAYEKSLVHKIFGGRLRSQVKCMQCSFCSNKFDPFLDLSLEIVKADSLYKALAHFTTKEQLDGGERQYQCQQCKQKVKALKQLTIHKAPYVLTIHLKRFGSHVQGQKIDKKIQFGPTLDLKSFVTGPYDGDLKYTLYGVLVHAGWSTHSGHYYCFVRTSSGMWYSLDDNQVVQVNERKVLEQKAYMLFYFRDRRNVASKKPVDVVQKEKLGISAMGNKNYSNTNGLKETIHSCATDKILYSPYSSAAVAQRDALNAGTHKDTPINGSYCQKSNDLMQAECLAVSRGHLLESSSKVPPPKVSVTKGISVLNLNGGICFPEPASSAKGSDDRLKLDNAMNVAISAKIVDCNVGNCTKKDPSNSVSVPSSCNGPYSCVTKKDLGDSLAIQPSCNENRSANKDPGNSVVIPASCDERHRSSRVVCSTEKISSGEGCGTKIFGKIVGGFSKESGVGNSVSEKVGDIVRVTVDVESAEIVNQSTTTGISLHRKALDHKLLNKIKKKLLKGQATSMRLGSNILLGTTLSLQKKKYKWSKHHTSGMKNLNHEHLLDEECVLSDLGPSTSEKIKILSNGGSAHSQRKRTKSGLHKKFNSVNLKNVTNSSCDGLMTIVNEELIDTDGQNDNVLATDTQLKRNCSPALVGSLLDARGSNSSSNGGKDAMQNGFMSMLTRGLEKTTVARWDDTELPLYEIMESRGVESVSIGYVADEWDEEYDRGKRKKVRSSKLDFGGPNPFQEIATKKAKLKMDQSSSGNQPFRIF